MTLSYLSGTAIRGRALLALLLASRVSMAAGAEVPATPTAKTELPPSSLSEQPAATLSVYSDGVLVSAESLRLAIAAELGAEVVLATPGVGAPLGKSIVITYHPSTRELAVSVRHPGRTNTTRVVQAPEDPAEVVTVAALLASNLARETAGETESNSAPVQPALTATAVAPQPLAATAVEGKPVAALPPLPPPEKVFATASFFYPLATNLDKPEIQTHLNFNLLYGHVGAIDGFELGFANAVSGQGRGVEVGVLANWIGGSFEGLQIGGLFNRTANMKGVQLSFGANQASGDRLGGQISGVANLTTGVTSGVGVTLGLNLTRAAEGIEVAGLANVLRGDFMGFAAAPFNYAHDVEGVQLGLINVARKVHGVQLGLINVADDVEGVPIGLISVTRSGGVHPMFWASTASLANVGLKFATRYTYTYLNVSGKEIDEHLRIGPGIGFGVSVPVLSKLSFEPDLGVTHLIGTSNCCTQGPFSAVERRRDETLGRLRGALRYQFIKHFSLFVGTGVVGRLTYLLDDGGDTDYQVRGLVEGFGGVEL